MVANARFDAPTRSAWRRHHKAHFKAKAEAEAAALASSTIAKEPIPDEDSEDSNDHSGDLSHRSVQTDLSLLNSDAVVDNLAKTKPRGGALRSNAAAAAAAAAATQVAPADGRPGREVKARV